MVQNDLLSPLSSLVLLAKHIHLLDLIFEFLRAKLLLNQLFYLDLEQFGNALVKEDSFMVLEIGEQQENHKILLITVHLQTLLQVLLYTLEVLQIHFRGDYSLLHSSKEFDLP